MKIGPLDVHDDEAMQAFWQVEQAAQRHDRERPVLRTREALLSSWRTPSPYSRREPLVAALEGRVVGVVDLGYSIGDNEHLADLEVSVLPTHRRRGIARALHAEATRRRRAEGRTHAMGEVHTRPGDVVSPGLAFALALGYESAHVEHHLVLDLPCDITRLGRPSADEHADYEIVTWTGSCPDRWVESYLEMRNRMNADVPVGDLDYAPPTLDLDRLRVGEQRLSRDYEILVAAARRADGVMGGYSLTYLPHGSEDAIQDDTLVMPDHRGRHLGLALKAVTLAAAQRDHRERKAYHTYTDPGNHAMYRTNEQFGYRLVEVMHEVQIQDG